MYVSSLIHQATVTEVVAGSNMTLTYITYITPHLAIYPNIILSMYVSSIISHPSGHGD